MEELLREAEIGSRRPQSATPEQIFPEPSEDQWQAYLQTVGGGSEGPGARGGGSFPIMAIHRGVLTLDAYKGLLTRTFGPRQTQAIAAMRKKPVMEVMTRVWDPLDAAVNRHVCDAFDHFFAPHLGAAFGFKPVPVSFTRKLEQEPFLGMFLGSKVLLSERLLHGEFLRFVNVYVHEQTHAFQSHLVNRLAGRRSLSLEETALADFWNREAGPLAWATRRVSALYRHAPTIRSRAYRKAYDHYARFGEEVHARLAGETVSAALTTFEPTRSLSGPAATASLDEWFPKGRYTSPIGG